MVSSNSEQGRNWGKPTLFSTGLAGDARVRKRRGEGGKVRGGVSRKCGDPEEWDKCVSGAPSPEGRGGVSPEFSERAEPFGRRGRGAEPFGGGLAGDTRVRRGRGEGGQVRSWVTRVFGEGQDLSEVRGGSERGGSGAFRKDRVGDGALRGRLAKGNFCLRRGRGGDKRVWGRAFRMSGEEHDLSEVGVVKICGGKRLGGSARARPLGRKGREECGRRTTFTLAGAGGLGQSLGEGAEASPQSIFLFTKLVKGTSGSTGRGWGGKGLGRGSAFREGRVGALLLKLSV